MDVELIRRSIRTWFEEGAREGRRYLVVWQDNFNAMDEDFGLYPDYADDLREVQAQMERRADNRFEKLMEILDLHQDFGEQIKSDPRRSIEEILARER